MPVQRKSAGVSMLAARSRALWQAARCHAPAINTDQHIAALRSEKVAAQHITLPPLAATAAREAGCPGGRPEQSPPAGSPGPCSDPPLTNPTSLRTGCNGLATADVLAAAWLVSCQESLAARSKVGRKSRRQDWLWDRQRDNNKAVHLRCKRPPHVATYSSKAPPSMVNTLPEQETKLQQNH